MSRIPKDRGRPYDTTEPSSIDRLLSELFQARGYNRFKANAQLQEIWNEVAKEFPSETMKAREIKNGVLEVQVSNSALLYQLDSYYKEEFLHTLQTEHKHLKIRDIKFRLKGSIEK